jgi:predicted Zn finger-like uncharacterized protein
LKDWQNDILQNPANPKILSILIQTIKYHDHWDVPHKWGSSCVFSYYQKNIPIAMRKNMVRISCPSCGTQFRVDQHKFMNIKSVKCKKCATVFPWREHIGVRKNKPRVPSDKPSSSAITPGTVFNERYQIKKVLGQGSMGITYKATDLETKHSVAVKILHFSQIQEWKALELFEREAKILQQLHHPRIPAYIDYFSVETSSETKFVLVQDFVEGKTLQQRVKESWRGTEPEIIDVFMQLLEICTYLHTHQPQVIHRDINPKNIILSPTNEVYLVDFGTGREIIRTTVYGGSTIVGTFGYIPFEQFSGQATPASDYYALGGTLLYMLTHRHPSDFPAEGLKLTLPPSLQTSPNILRLLERLLEPDVKKRVASPEEVRRILQEKIERLPEPQKAPSKTVITKIKKILKRTDHVRFEIPVGFSDLSTGELSKAKFESYGLEGFIPIVLIPLGIISAVLFGSPFFLLIFFGGGVLSPIITPYIIWPRFGRHVIEMTPTDVQVSEECSGKKVHSLRIPIVGLQTSDIALHFEVIGLGGKPKPVLGINHGGRTIEFCCAKLSQEEIQWLIQELKEYISTHGK